MITLSFNRVKIKRRDESFLLLSGVRGADGNAMSQLAVGTSIIYFISICHLLIKSMSTYPFQRERYSS